MNDFKKIFFSNHLSQYSERVCLYRPDAQPITYATMLEKADAIGNAFGVPKKLIFIEGRNTVESIAAYIGCLRAGHAVHLVDPCKVTDNQTLIEQYRPHVFIKFVNDDVEIDTIHSEPIDIHPDLAILLATSGSTGSKKLVKLSYENIQSNTLSIIDYLDLKSDDCAITSLKFHYSYGMSIVNTHLAAGGSLVLTENSVQESSFWECLKEFPVTNFSGVPYTYQIVDHMKVDFSQYKALRFLTQAGGKLTPDMVVKFAKKLNAQDIRFFVMYGQTEASPRMSYLPAEMAIDNSDCIGLPIPNGELMIVDDNKANITDNEVPGELAYKGPNIMMGYAYSYNDLGSKEKIEVLYTGDLAIKKNNGLFKIVGRKSRFVKPFGVRVSLDDIEVFLSGKGVTGYAVGNDKEIATFVHQGNETNFNVSRLLAEKYNLPISLFTCHSLEEIPQLANGKVNYLALKDLLNNHEEKQITSYFSLLWLLVKNFVIEAWYIVFGGTGRWTSVEEIFQMCFSTKEINQDESFISLGGDSLLYVEMSICLEEYLGRLPEKWHEKTIAELRGANA